MREPGAEPQKHALLIGIDHYPRMDALGQLEGCVNDVELMADNLKRNFGFPPGAIQLLRNEEASRQGILGALDTLVRDRIKKNDIVVVHYSGHGSQMTDREGDEADGLDETLVPCDSGRGQHENRDISDDEIHLWLLELTEITPFVTLIFDCCHSGTVHRDRFGAKARWIPPDDREIEDLPPSPVLEKLPRLRSVDSPTGPSGWLPPGERYVLIAACRDAEISYELPRSAAQGVPHGTLTYRLCEELRTAESGTTYRDVFERASARVTADHSWQHPQLEGARDRKLFGVETITPTKFIPVRERSGIRVILAAGAAHGLSVGSEWAVYPQGAKRTVEKECLGRVRVSSVGALSAQAAILDEKEDRVIGPASRAVEDSHRYGEMRLVVEVPNHRNVPELAELVGRFQDSNVLRLVTEGEKGQARVSIIPPRRQATPEDPAPQIRKVDEPTWAVVDTQGQLLMPARPLTDIDAKFLLLENLEKYARYRHALALENRDSETELRDKVDFRLLRLRADGIWEDADLRSSVKGIEFLDGDQLGLRITNQHRDAVYTYVLDFGLTGSISQLYPVPGRQEPLEPGIALEVGIRRGDELDLFMPQEFPFDGEGCQGRPPVGGTGFIKLFATTQETDFSELLQNRMRDPAAPKLRGEENALGKLLTMRLSGRLLRDTRCRQGGPVEDWTMVTRAFFLRRRNVVA